MKELKNAWKSWVIWFNSVAMGLLAGLPAVADAFPQIHGFIPDTYYKVLGAIIIGGNIALRFKTSKSLADK